jgi:hypothetical protein
MVKCSVTCPKPGVMLDAAKTNLDAIGRRWLRTFPDDDALKRPHRS